MTRQHPMRGWLRTCVRQLACNPGFRTVELDLFEHSIAAWPADRSQEDRVWNGHHGTG